MTTKHEKTTEPIFKSNYRTLQNLCSSFDWRKEDPKVLVDLTFRMRFDKFFRNEQGPLQFIAMLFRCLSYVAKIERTFTPFPISILLQPKQETRRHLLESMVGVLVDQFWSRYVPHTDPKPCSPKKTIFCIIRYKEMKNSDFELYYWPWQVGCEPDHAPSAWHVLVRSPTSL